MPIRRGSIHRDPDIEYKLSQIEIDRDKNWAGKGIDNIRELSAGTALGDIAIRGETLMRELVPGYLGYFLVSNGPGRMPVWSPFSADWVKFFGAHILLSHAEGIVVPDHTTNETGDITTAETHDNHYLDSADIVASQSSAIVSPDHSENLGGVITAALTYSVA